MFYDIVAADRRIMKGIGKRDRKEKGTMAFSLDLLSFYRHKVALF